MNISLLARGEPPRFHPAVGLSQLMRNTPPMGNVFAEGPHPAFASTQLFGSAEIRGMDTKLSAKHSPKMAQTREPAISGGVRHRRARS